MTDLDTALYEHPADRDDLKAFDGTVCVSKRMGAAIAMRMRCLMLMQD